MRLKDIDIFGRDRYDVIEGSLVGRDPRLYGIMDFDSWSLHEIDNDIMYNYSLISLCD